MITQRPMHFPEPGQGRVPSLVWPLLASVVFFATACRIEPSYSGEPVRCTTDENCSELPGGVFVCDPEAGLCVRDDGNGDGPACPAGCHPPIDQCLEDGCAAGVLQVDIQAPADGTWVKDGLSAAGTVTWTGVDWVTVECTADIGGETVRQAATIGEEAEGPLSWQCDLSLDPLDPYEGAPVLLQVEATDTGERAGGAEVGLRWDGIAPAVTILEPEDGAVIGPPGTIGVLVHVLDGGSLAEGRITVLDESGQTVFDDVYGPDVLDPATEACIVGEGGGVECTLSLEGQAPPSGPAGSYTVTVRMEDGAGNAGSDERSFSVEADPPVITLTVPAEPVQRDGEITATLEIAGFYVAGTVEATLTVPAATDLGDDPPETLETLEMAVTETADPGVYTARLSARAVPLPTRDAAFTVSARVDGAWGTSDASGEEPVQVTRLRWASNAYCQGRETCRNLSPAEADDGTLYVATTWSDSGGDGYALRAIDPAGDGEPGEPLAMETGAAGLYLAAGPVVHDLADSREGDPDRQIYLLHASGVLQAVDGVTGSQRWKIDEAALASLLGLDLGGTTLAVKGAPAVTPAGRLFLPVTVSSNLSTGTRLVVLDDAGTLIGEHAFSGQMWTASSLVVRPAAAGGDGVVWIAAVDTTGRAVSIRCEPGSCQHWTDGLGGSRMDELAADAEHFYVTLDGTDGARTLAYPWSADPFSSDPAASVSTRPLWVSALVAGRRLVMAEGRTGTDARLVATSRPGADETFDDRFDLAGPVYGLVLGRSGLVYLNLNAMDTVVAMSAEDGSPSWVSPAGHPVLEVGISPLLTREGLLVVSGGGGLLTGLVSDDMEGPASGWSQVRGNGARHGAVAN